MGCLPRIRFPRRLRRLFSKKKKNNHDDEPVELMNISHPFDVYRIDSKGNRVEMPRHLPPPADLYGQVVEVAGPPATVGTGLTYCGIPVPDGSAVTDGSASDISTSDNKLEAAIQAKKDTGAVVAGPAPKDF